MESHYLMGNNDFLVRTSSTSQQPTKISESLRNRFIKLGMQEAITFYSSFFDKSAVEEGLELLSQQYHESFEHASSLGLFQQGGIAEKDHLNFWCLSHVFQPETYVESGVFIGCSLHAFSQSNSLKKIIAIDPDLSVLKIPRDELINAGFIDDKDFSQVEIEFDSERTLVYFDDHINSASRIIQASEKKLKYLLFDDSTGLHGVCQRLYPAVPTIPMIRNYESFSLGDTMQWTYARPLPKLKKSFVERLFSKSESPSHEFTTVSLKVTEGFVDQCREANSRIKRVVEIPNLATYVPQENPSGMLDVTKYLIELNS